MKRKLTLASVRVLGLAAVLFFFVLGFILFLQFQQGLKRLEIEVKAQADREMGLLSGALADTVGDENWQTVNEQIEFFNRLSTETVFKIITPQSEHLTGAEGEADDAQVYARLTQQVLETGSAVTAADRNAFLLYYAQPLPGQYILLQRVNWLARFQAWRQNFIFQTLPFVIFFSLFFLGLLALFYQKTLNKPSTALIDPSESFDGVERGRPEIQDPLLEPAIINQADSPTDDMQLKRYQEALIFYHQRYQHLIENLNDIVFSLDAQGYFTYVSPAVERLLGYKPEELMDRPAADILAPESVSVFQSNLKAALQNNLAPLEFQVMDIAGNPHDVRTVNRPIMEEGKTVGLAGVMTDISDWKRTQTQVQTREAILEAISLAAEEFLSSVNWEENIMQKLARFGEVVNATQAYIYERAYTDHSELIARRRYFWLAPEVEEHYSGVSMQPFDIRIGRLKNWLQMLEANQIIQGNICDSTPSEARFLQLLGIQSMLVVPIFVEGDWWGFIGFSDDFKARRWSQAEEGALKIAASVLGAAIQRKIVEDKIKDIFEGEREQRLLAQVLQEAGASLSASLDFNDVLDRLLDEIPKLVPYDTARIWLVEGVVARNVRSRGFEGFEDMIPEQIEYRGLQNLNWMVEHRKALVISDVHIDPRWVMMDSDSMTRSWVGAPIIAQEKTIGFISLRKYMAGFYQQRHANLLAAFSSQAALAMQNARSYQETLEGLERERALNEVTRAISSALDLPVILQNVVRLAVMLVRADSGALGIVDPKSGDFDYQHIVSLSDIAVDYSQGDMISEHILEKGEPVWISQSQSFPALQIPPLWQEAGIHDLISVPLRAGEERLGVLHLLGGSLGNHFEERELGLAESVGRQAGVAIQNAGLFQAVKQRAEEAEKLRQASANIASALDLDQVLERILEDVSRMVEYDSASVFLVEGKNLVLAANKGALQREAILNQVFPQDELFKVIWQARQPLAIKDAKLDPRFKGWGKTSDVRGWMGLPFFIRDELIGYLTLDSRSAGKYNQTDALLLQSLVNEAAFAIENARLFKQVQNLARTDPLTGLFNRRYFFDFAEREFQRLKRYGGDLSVIILDVDYFKMVNDTYGHLVGDQALQEFARRCRQNLREVDVIARYGGEEFVVLLPETGPDMAVQAAERLKTSINDMPFQIEDFLVNISASIGVASSDRYTPDLEVLMGHADHALYAAKEAGRGRIKIWDEIKDGADADPDLT